MKKLKKLSTAFAIIGALTLGLVACKSGPKDSDLVAAAQKILPEGIKVEIKKGEASISGEFIDDIAKQEAENQLKSITGIKKVINNSTVKPVIISVDDVLKNKVIEILKGYPGVNADIKEGVITLTGELKRDNWMKLKQTLDGLKPKKVENKLTLK